MLVQLGIFWLFGVTNILRKMIFGQNRAVSCRFVGSSRRASTPLVWLLVLSTRDSNKIRPQCQSSLFNQTSIGSESLLEIKEFMWEEKRKQEQEYRFSWVFTVTTVCIALFACTKTPHALTVILPSPDKSSTAQFSKITNRKPKHCGRNPVVRKHRNKNKQTKRKAL